MENTLVNVDVVSDIHVDHYNLDPVAFENFLKIFKGGDILLIAGDTSTTDKIGKKLAVQFLKEVSSRYDYVVYVKGNHDFYDGKERYPDPNYNYVGLENVILLNRATIKLKDLNISGCFAFYETGAPMNDIYMTLDAVDFYKREKQYDLNFLSKIESTDILLSHTPLSYQAIAPKFQGNEYNKYYYHDREDLIVKGQPQLYISGHTHNIGQYNVYHDSSQQSSTLCVSHAAGYKGEIKVNYKPRRFIFKNSKLIKS